MIPIIYPEKNYNLERYGRGVLRETIECSVKERLNDYFELELTYPLDGAYANEIQISRIIKASVKGYDNEQLFRISNIQKTKTTIKVTAEHVSYQLNYLVTKPLTATSVSQAFTKIVSGKVGDNPFTFTAVQSSPMTGTLETKNPTAVRGLLLGKNGLLNIFGGDIVFDNFDVKYYQTRGGDKGANFRYGSNIINISTETSLDDVLTSICPYYYKKNNDEETFLMLSGTGYIDFDSSVSTNYPFHRVFAVDLTSEFEDDEEVNETNLRAKANTYLQQNSIGYPLVSLTVDPVLLKEFSNYNNVPEDVAIGDYVTVKYPLLDVEQQARIVSYDWDVINERFNNFTIGADPKDLSDFLASKSTGVSSSGGGGSISIDTAMSSTSANAVQNKVIKAYVDSAVPTKTSDLTNDSNFVSDSNYVHTDNNFTTTLKNKLNGIASGAEVNVQSDWNQTNTSADDYIKNKPSGLMQRVWYGTCDDYLDAGSGSVTTTSGDFSFTAGSVLFVKFAYRYNITEALILELSVDVSYTHESAMVADGGEAEIAWADGETVCFVYDGTKFNILKDPKLKVWNCAKTSFTNGVISADTPAGDFVLVDGSVVILTGVGSLAYASGLKLCIDDAVLDGVQNEYPYISKTTGTLTTVSQLSSDTVCLLYKYPYFIPVASNNFTASYESILNMLNNNALRGLMVNGVSATVNNHVAQINYDSTMSDTSTNAVQNKTIKSYIDQITPTGVITDVQVGGVSVVTNHIAQIPSIDDKADALNPSNLRWMIGYDNEVDARLRRSGTNSQDLSLVYSWGNNTVYLNILKGANGGGATVNLWTKGDFTTVGGDPTSGDSNTILTSGDIYSNLVGYYTGEVTFNSDITTITTNQIRRIGRMVQLNIRFTTPSTLTSSFSIGTLPTGFRPMLTTYAVGQIAWAKDSNAIVAISSAGNIGFINQAYEANKSYIVSAMWLTTNAFPS